ncbi:MAG: ATP synthase F1 subunit delta [Anaerolineae bacterium]|nr:ATP synthase F1 subunit delta [Anaerolineae bacterium]MDW8071237.1 ATP synthase F1 subunit delta [Anaerolineae bacterium]
MVASRLEDLARRYARAAYQHTTEGWLDNLRRVQERLAEPDKLQTLSDVGQPFSVRKAQLDALLPADIREDVRNFLYALLKEGQLGLLEAIIAELARLSEYGPEVLVARVTTTIPLTDEEKAAFRERIHAAHGDRVDIEFRVDPSILGGVVVQIGDRVVDGSIAGKLRALRDRLVAAR